MAMALRSCCCQNIKHLPLIALPIQQSIFHINLRHLCTKHSITRPTTSLWNEPRHSDRFTKAAHKLTRASTFYDAGCRQNSTVAASNSFNSSVALASTTQAAAESLTSGVDISSPVLDLSTFLTDGAASTLASATIEPSLASLGLGGWAPSGCIQSALEAIHVGLGIPWWTSIVVVTVCIRVAIFPLVILAQRNAAHMHNHMPTMTRLQEKMTKARASGDVTEAMSTSAELMAYMKRNNVNPLKNMLPPLAQLPIFISVFTGVRAMASLPVESMKMGGLFWFTDLTIPDPFYALPVLSMVTLLGVIEVGADGVKADQMQKQIRYLLRAMPFICFPFIVQFPSAMLCYWLTSNIISLIQVLLLRIPGVKPFFNIPALVDHGISKHIRVSEDAPKKSFMEGFRETIKNLEIASEMEERKRHNALHLKKSTKSIIAKQTAVVVDDKSINQSNDKTKF